MEKYKKKYNVILRINIFITALCILGSVYIYSNFMPDILFMKIPEDNSNVKEFLFDEEAILFIIYIIFIFFMIFEIVFLIGYFKYRKDFTYLYKINFVAFIVLSIVFILCSVCIVYDILLFLGA